ncbi:MAG: type III-A CRISPR-associated RAMP protein Csm5 [Deltaproteobacteria bacterium]|nr:type III-A CRISPR-associated RAMP protein Csm5 [Deltaproteobacteria bacterium]MBW2065539.1 type III-A CRISPR-associated RAMP protein Csm5 [Deltaproteobacteria bacterium]
MNGTNHGQLCFSVITPVHIGSGEKLNKVDVAVDSNRCVVVDVESLLLRLQDNKDALNEFGHEGFNMTRFLRKFKISPKSVEKYSIHNKGRVVLKERFKIQEMIKTGLGNPYIPGSSIKGAIRTVLLWHLFNKEPSEETNKILNRILHNPKVEKEHADNDLEKHFFGNDPNHDFMRALQVGDIEFRAQDLKLAESKVLSLRSNNSFGWKKMGRKGFTSSNPREATSIYCEALTPGATSTGRLRIEKFLLDHPLSAKELKFSGKKELLDGLPEKCNQFATAFIDKEIEFYDICNMKDLVKFYTNLRERISQEGNGAFFLHLGWGSGWRAMTGNYLDDDTLMKFRKLFGLGKSICPKCGKESKRDKNKQGYSFCPACKKTFPTHMFGAFPKTRKIAFEDGSSRYPLGWIKVEMAPETGDESRPTKEEKRPKPTPPKGAISEKFEKFRLKPSPEHFKTFIEDIGGEEIREIETLSFSSMKDVINIGFVTPLEQANVPDQVRRLIAEKILGVIEKKRNWKSEKLAKYEKLLHLAKAD